MMKNFTLLVYLLLVSATTALSQSFTPPEASALANGNLNSTYVGQIINVDVPDTVYATGQQIIDGLPAQTASLIGASIDPNSVYGIAVESINFTVVGLPAGLTSDCNGCVVLANTNRDIVISGTPTVSGSSVIDIISQLSGETNIGGNDFPFGGTFSPPGVPIPIPVPALPGVSDALGYSLDVSPNPSLTTTVSQNATSCSGADVNVTVNGSVPPITYSFNNSNPITTPTSVIMLSNLSAGQYNVTGVDDTGNTFDETFTVSGITPYQNESICIVTVDSVSGNNLVVWEKTLGVDTDYFKIYKQNSINSQYDSVGHVDFSALSTFEDLISNPQQNSDRYKVSVVDICGGESNVSAAHRTIHLTANQGINDEVNLSWNAYEGFSYPNFEIYRSNNSNPYNLIATVANNSFSYTDLTPPVGTNYYRIAVVNPSGCTPTRNVLKSYSNVIDNSGNPVAINEIGSIEFELYPNPSSDILNIKLVEGLDSWSYSVSDNLGRIVLNGAKSDISAQLDVTELDSGIYTVRIETNRGNSSRKFVKQ